MARKRVVVVGVVVIIVAGASVLTLKRYVESLARAHINETLGSMTQYADVNYGDVTVDLLGRAVHLSDLAITPVGLSRTLRIEEVIVREVGKGTPIPTSLRIMLRGIKVSADDLSAIDPSATFKLVGDTSIQGDVEVAYRYAPDDGKLDVARLGISLPALFTSSLALRLDHLNLGAPDWLHFMMSLEGITLEQADLRFEDTGLLAWLVVARAEQQGVTIEQATQQMLTDAKANIPVDGSLVTPAVQKELADFVAHPGNLHLTVAPKVPIAVGRLAGGWGAARSLSNLNARLDVVPGRTELLAASRTALSSVVASLVVEARREMREQQWERAAAVLQRGLAVSPDDATLRNVEHDLDAAAGYPLDIRTIDFRNFTYDVTGCVRDADGRALTASVPVSGGQGKLSIGAATMDFGIVDIIYGDVTGDGLSEALVFAACNNPGANAGLDQIFVFGLTHGKPVLFGAFTNEAVNADYRRAFGGFMWNSLHGGISNNQVTLTGFAEGPHAQPRYEVRFAYRWAGGQFVLAKVPERTAAKWN
jgi:hypothetical protein